MKIATWNVNSLNVRLGHVTDWIADAKPDVLALQEIKQTTETFPTDTFADLGFQSVASGQKTYNGVAVLSRYDQQDIVTDLPGFQDPQRRVLATTIDDTRIIDVYVPNGSRVDSDKYAYKLRWLEALSAYLADELDTHRNVVVLGDFNIAPEDRDVYDAEKWGDGILCSPAERGALQGLFDLGFVDVFRRFSDDEQAFSWWDYRAAAFRRNRGLRINLILANESFAERCTASDIDPTPRAWDRPSDHAPVIAEFDV